MATKDHDTSESWDLQNAFNLLTPTPLDFACSLWDNFAPVDDYNSHFISNNTPASDARPSCPSSNIGTGCEVQVDFPGSQQHNRSLKRRRMLLFSCSSEDSKSDEPLETVVGTRTFPICSDSYEDIVESDPSLAISRPWFDPQGPFSDLGHSWMGNRSYRGNVEEQRIEENGDKIAISPEEIMPADMTLAWEARPLNEEISPDMVAVNQTSAPADECGSGRHKLRLGTRTSKLVYPFALVRPCCGLHGDATLQDINKQILMGISNSNNWQRGRSSSSSKCTSSSSSPSNSSCSSTLPSVESSPGRSTMLIGAAPSSTSFSGKSVVALTKIHTQGKGTITIRRTRG